MFEVDDTGEAGLFCFMKRTKFLTAGVLLLRDFLHLPATGQFNFPSSIREGLCLDYLTSRLLPSRLLLRLHPGDVNMSDVCTVSRQTLSGGLHHTWHYTYS